MPRTRGRLDTLPSPVRDALEMSRVLRALNDARRQGKGAEPILRQEALERSHRFLASLHELRRLRSVVR